MDVTGFDGTRLNMTQMGEGTPMLLLHGLFSSADINWLRFGTAKRLVAAGYRLFMPDFRGHGRSESPRAAEAYPADVLALDTEAIVAQLGLGDDFILCGYSMGARTAVRLMARGMRPRRAILAGMGLQGLVGGDARASWFIRMIEGRGSWPRGSGEFMAEAFMKSNIRDPDMMVHLLRSQQATAAEELAALKLPILVLCGADDADNGSAPDLAAALPNAEYAEIPGNHMASVTKAALADAMIDWLRKG